MMAFGPKKDGGPNTKYFEAPETLTSLEVVRQWLQKNGKKVKYHLLVYGNLPVMQLKFQFFTLKKPEFEPEKLYCTDFH